MAPILYEVFSFEKCAYKTCLTYSVDIFAMTPSFSLGSHSIQNGEFFFRHNTSQAILGFGQYIKAVQSKHEIPELFSQKQK